MAGAVTVCAVAAIGIGQVGVMTLRGAAERALADEQAAAESLKRDREQYTELLELKDRIAASQAALTASMAYEIAWPVLLTELLKSKPEGAVVTAIGSSGMTATEAMSESANPLAPRRVGVIILRLRVPTLVGLAEWIDTLNATPGMEMADWTVAQLTQDDADGSWDVTCSVNINLRGLSGRALPESFTQWLAGEEAGE
jgi:hypothetical protein